MSSSTLKFVSHISGRWSIMSSAGADLIRSLIAMQLKLKERTMIMNDEEFNNSWKLLLPKEVLGYFRKTNFFTSIHELAIDNWSYSESNLLR